MGEIQPSSEQETNQGTDDIGHNETEKQEYVAKLMDKLKDMDDSDDDDDPADAIDSSHVPTKPNDTITTVDVSSKAEDNVAKLKDALDNHVDLLPDQEEIDKVGLIVPQDPEIEMIGTKPLHNALNSRSNIMFEKLQMTKVRGITTQFITRLKQSRFFQSNPGAMTLPSNSDKATMSLFTHDQNLGKGWKVRYYAVARPRSNGLAREFLSPEGLRLKSADAVVEYMKCIGKYHNSHIQSVKDYLRIS